MPDYESLLNRWQSAGVLDAEAANRILSWESAQASAAAPLPTPVPPKEVRAKAPSAPTPKEQVQVAGLAWQGRVALILGGILLASGIILFVSAHWDQLGPGIAYLLVMAMVTVFHAGGAVTRERYRATSTTLHAVGTISTGAAIALVGQIFNIQEHWPAAILMWAIAALLGWILLRDEAQQVLTLLLVPSWLICEWSYAADNHIGVEIYVGRFLFVWAILYLTFFIGTERRVVRGILLASLRNLGRHQRRLAPRLAGAPGPVCSLTRRSTRAYWGWVDIAAAPLLFSSSASQKHCTGACRHRFCHSVAMVYTHPGGALHLRLVDAFRTEHPRARTRRVFLRLPHLVGSDAVSRGLVNLGIVFFGTTVVWFYFSDLFDKMDRSLALIGLGVLFLAGGWALEKTRRRLLAHMAQSPATLEEAP